MQSSGRPNDAKAFAAAGRAPIAPGSVYIPA